MSKSQLTNGNNSKFLIYETNENKIKITVMVDEGSIWLTQKKMSELFGVEVKTINEHLMNIYESSELEQSSTIRKSRIVQIEGKREITREILIYNLDAIISVGYRVNSTQATQFRIWATSQLRDLIIKGFVLNDDLLKQGQDNFGQDYFRELLERIRSIRSNERRIWLQITDIFAECSSDYNSKSSVAIEFFSIVQNKFHYAITGLTAAEIVYNKASHLKPKMGLLTYKNSPNGRVLKSDATIAKNYLSENEIKKLERTVSSFFDYIEGIVERRQTFDMNQFIESVDKFLSFNEYKLLISKGNVSHKSATQRAESEYDIFNKNQKIESDFEKISKKFLKSKGNE